MLVLYEIVEKDEEYRMEGKNSTEVINWIEKNEHVKTTRQNIAKAKKNGHAICGKYLLFEMDFEEEVW